MKKVRDIRHYQKDTTEVGRLWNAIVAVGRSSREKKKKLGQTLCEDCYMDALSPVRTCDPWAVRSAKSFEKYAESAPILIPTLSQIFSILKETGGIEPEALLRKPIGELTQKELEREFAALRHMEKARGEKRGDRVVWRLR